MLKIGITGGIGVGKSTISTFFSTLGVPIYNADQCTKWLQNNEPTLIQRITEMFGANSYSNGVLDASYLGSIVFHDANKLKLLNELVHPFVKIHAQKWYLEQKNTPYVLREAALLIETGMYRDLDKLIVVSSPIHLRIARIKKRDQHRTESDIEAIIQRQLPESEKLAVADYVIYNDEKQSIITQCLLIDRELRALSK